MLFQLDDVHKSYGALEVLRGASFQVNPRERVGLVGRNGVGKTTVFRLIAGLEEPDHGQVTVIRGLRIGLLEQRPAFSGHLSIRDEALSVFTELKAMEDEMARLEHVMAEAAGEALDEAMHAYSDLRHRYQIGGGFSYHPRANSVLTGLGFKADELTRPADQLSGGQKSRLALARLLLAEPDVLLLDEPTNHLDVGAVEWLEDFLADYAPAFVIISHDRFLIDRTATKIVEIDSGRATVYAGNYSAYVRQREERRLTQTRQYERQQEMIARTEEFIRRNIAGQKTKQAKSRRKMLERMDRVEAVRNERAIEFTHKGESFSARGPGRVAGGSLLSVTGLAIGYGETALATDISLILQRGERLGIIGPNGSGKTTFLKTLIGELEPLAGSLTWGANAQIGYYDQELSKLDSAKTVIEELGSIVSRFGAPSDLNGRSRRFEQELRSYLAKFMFTGDEVFKPVAALSGGERSRLALAKLIHGRPSVLVLDEPTNHLDIPSREALETALEEYGGSIITASHDRYFLDRMATGILHFEDRSATYHLGTYSSYYTLRHRRPTDVSEVRSKSRAARDSRSGGRDRATAARARQGRLIEDIEQEISLLESELAELAGRLSNPQPGWGPEHYAEIGTRHDVIRARLDLLYREWEEAATSSSNRGDL